MNDVYNGFVPYIYCDDAAKAIDWYTRVFDFQERSRWSDESGVVGNAELEAGNSEIWLDGSGRRNDHDLRQNWIGVWVDDVDAMYSRVRNAGVHCDEPVDREFGVRMLSVADEMGYVWGFMKRI